MVWCTLTLLAFLRFAGVALTLATLHMSLLGTGTTTAFTHYLTAFIAGLFSLECFSLSLASSALCFASMASTSNCWDSRGLVVIAESPPPLGNVTGAGLSFVACTTSS